MNAPSAWILAVIVPMAACATPPPVAPLPRAPVTPVAPVTQAPVPVHESTCWAKGRPQPIVATKKDDSTFCAPIDGAELSRVEAKVRKELVDYQKPSKLVVDFGCDLAWGPLKEVIFEDGSGHGGSLRLVRFHRSLSIVEVRVLGSSHYQNPGFAVDTAQMSAKDLDALVARSRVAMLARPHFIPLFTPGAGLGLSGMSSSNDFHLRLRLVDERGRTTDRHFTGYDSSNTQEEVVPMRLAAEPFEKLLSTIKLTREPSVTEEDKAFFMERFLETMHGDAHAYWWIKERLVALSSTFGTIDAVPALVALTKQKGGGSVERTRDAAVTSIAAITGWDPRIDAQGRPRTIDQAVAAIAKECVP